MTARVIGPAGIPDFSPFNLGGRKLTPRIKWVQGKPVEDELYQVHVKTTDGKRVPVGPKTHKSLAEDFCEAIHIQIAKGREMHWSSPLVVRCAPSAIKGA